MHALTLPPPQHFDEMLLASGAIRPQYQGFADWLHSQTPQALAAKRAEADLLFHKVGITFAVYGDEAGAERLIPFDTVPRIMPADEWTTLQAGLRQRVTALNRFLHDIYHDHAIVKAGLIPAEQVFANAQYQPAMQGLTLPHQIYAHITGVDLIRHADGHYYVLEDNLRVPSGVSYMLENRKMMMRLFPELFDRYSVAPVAHYPTLLLNTLRQAATVDDPTVVVLTPGPANSAYFEHAFLAQQMGVELVEGQDLFVKGGYLYMRTTVGPKRVDVIYRRIDDAFLDPLAFRADSMLGVPGLLSVYKQGHLVLANAIGTGVADDKSIYPYVPDMVRFYLGEEPILRNVPTWQCRKPDDCAHVLANLKDLVVKEVHGAGGYGMLVGPAATQQEISDFAERVKADPSNYIAQPTLALSNCPTFVESGIAPRHIDLRPFVLSGREINMVAGGLTRVALKAGSLVVNSSQGGGTKDTWILEGAAAQAGGELMLSRTASQLYWMSRYMERAENLVRILDVTQSLSLMPQSRGAATELAAPLAVTGSLQAYQARHSKFDAKRLFEFMALDLENPASVLSCLRSSRENAHAVRGQITAEMWEAVNATWLEAKSLPKRLSGSPSAFFDWVKERSHLMRGATVGTLQRNDAYCFLRLGTFIERADNTARLLDVKSQLIEPAVDNLQPVATRQDSSADFYAWSALLRSLSAFEAYHAIYRDALDARRVAELLILRPDVPRSLRSCMAQVADVLPQIESRGGSLDAGRAPKLLAGQLSLRLQHADIDELVAAGLHQWITAFLAESAQLGEAIGQAYFEAH